MAAYIAYKSADRGARFRPPRMQVEIRRCLTCGGGRPGFSAPVDDWRVSPESMHWGCNGRLSTASLKYELGRNTEAAEHVPAENAADGLHTGDEVVLFTSGQGDGPFEADRQEWFRGIVGQQHLLIQSHRDFEGFEVVAYGPELRLRGKAICGQWNKTGARDDEEMAGGASQATARRSYVCQSGLPAVFNPGGRANASNHDFRLATLYDTGAGGSDESRCKVFEAVGRKVLDSSGSPLVEAVHWTAYTAVRSLVEWVDDCEVISPGTDWEGIESLLGEAVMGEISVQGMDLLEALRAVLLPLGFGFALEPWAERSKTGAETSPKRRHRLHVFSLRRRRGVVAKLPMARADRPGVSVASAAGQAVLVQRVDYVRDLHHVANEVVVVGDRRRRQVILQFNYHTMGDYQRDLVPLWDATQHSLANWAVDDVVDPTLWQTTGDYTADVFDQRYNKRGAENQLYKHVFRSFVWNEDGAFHALGYAAPDLKDFGVGDGVNFVRRVRPLGPTLLRDEPAGEVLNFPVRIQIGIDNEDLEYAWLDLPEAAVLPDRAGFTITRNVLAGGKDNETWRPYHGCLAKAADGKTLHEKYGHHTYLTLLHNTLRQEGVRIRIRMIGSVECDDAVTCTAARRIETPWPFSARKVVYAPNRFKWREVPAGTDLGLGQDRHDAVDDSAEAMTYAETIRRASEQGLGHGSVVLRGLHKCSRPGMAVPATTGRVVDFSVDGGRREQYPIIVGIAYHFAEGVSKTELMLDTSLLQLPR